MIDRYHAPHASTVFSDTMRIRRWTHLTKEYAREALDSAFPDDSADLRELIHSIEGPSPKAVQIRETYTRHDVVAFLSLIEQEADPKIHQYLHYGLTSSDLVENAHHDALGQHAQQLLAMCNSLSIVLRNRYLPIRQPRAGRTHGQVADVTQLDHQLHMHREVIRRIMRDLGEWPNMPGKFGFVTKSPGPTGTSPFRRAGVTSFPSSQIIPRDFQIEWATVYLRLAVELESLATLIRCGARSEIGELAEGVAVGSSAMPHKRNPVASEKVCGLARVARGHFMAIAENGAFWDDRDISNSSVERLAVPDLAATVEHMLFTMIGVVTNLVVDGERMKANAQDPRTASSILQTMAQKHFALGPTGASEFVQNHIQFDIVDGAFYFADNVPEGLDYMDAWINEARELWQGRLGAY